MSKGTKCRFYVDLMSANPGITGSCNIVVIKLPNGETLKGIVDCGLFQEKDYDKYNEELPFNPQDVNFTLVTHNHVDHTGRLPFMVKQGCNCGIYMSKTTTKLLPYALHDSVKVIREVAKFKNRKPIYTEVDTEKALRLRVPCEYGETVKINENVKVTFFMNGHLPGAAIILLQISYPEYEDINLLFTGDYNSKNMFFDVPELPKWVLDLPLTVIIESTYGDKDSSDIQGCFRQNVKNCIDSDGSVVAPVFSLGRTQEIMYVLKCMQEDGDLSKDIPIFLDGNLAIRYTNLYLNDGLDNKEEMKNFVPDNFTFVDVNNRSDVLKGVERKIILTTSGMGSYGPAQLYIPEYLQRKDSLIHFCGYSAEGTLGHRLKNTIKGQAVEVGGVLVKKVAAVEYTTEFSAHAKANEMIDFLKKFSNLKLVLVNHGQTEVKKKFAEKVLYEVNAKSVGILGDNYLFRVNTWGIVKTMPTKFYR